MGVMPIARLLLLFVLVPVMPALGANITVQATRNGDTLDIVAVADFEGDRAQTWRVLTDYARMAEYVPNLQVSRVVAREQNTVVVEQKGEARVLFFSYPINVRLAVTEHPQDRIESRALSGNFREMHSLYALESRQGHMLLRYSGRLVPDFFIPPVIGTLVLRRHVEDTFRAMVEEIERQTQSAASAKREP